MSQCLRVLNDNSEDSELYFQHPHCGSQTVETPVPGNLMPSSVLQCHLHICTAHQFM